MTRNIINEHQLFKIYNHREAYKKGNARKIDEHVNSLVRGRHPNYASAFKDAKCDDPLVKLTFSVR